MLKVRLFISLILLTQLSFVFAQGRKPAVEDFVGVETDNYTPTYSDTNVNFNFGNHIQAVSKIKKESTQNSSNDYLTWIVFSSFLLLPFFMWAGIQYSLRKSLKTDEFESELAEVKDFENYKKDKKDKEDSKKAS